MVAGGHVTDAPCSIIYYSVLLIYSVRVLFIFSELNDLKVIGCDIQNAYLTDPTREKIWTIAGPELGS